MLLLGIVLLARPRGIAGAVVGAAHERDRRVVADWLWPLVVFGALAVVPKIDVSIPKVFDQPISTPGTLAAARALPRLRRRSRSPTTCSSGSPACSRSGTRSTSRSASTSRTSRSPTWHWSFWPSRSSSRWASAFVLPRVLGAVSLRVGGIAFAMVTLAFAQAGSRARVQEPAPLDARRGGARRRLHEAAEGASSASSTRRTSTGSRSASPPSCSSSCAGRSSRRRARIWQAIRENELRVEVLGLRPYWYKLHGVRARVVPRDGRRHRLHAAAQRRDARRHAAELHADAARDGRDRRRRLALGRACSAASSTRTSNHRLDRDRELVDASRRCRRCCGRRSSSRSSCSGVLFILIVVFLPAARRPRGPRAAERAAPLESAARPMRASRGGSGVDRRNRDVRIAYEERGTASRSLLIQGLGYDRSGWGPLPDLLAERYRVVSFDNRGIGDSDEPDGPYTVDADGRGRACRCSTRRASSARTCSVRASAAMIAQELARRTPERVDKLVLCLHGAGRPDGRVPMPDGDGRGCSAAADDGAARSRCGASSRTRSAHAACASCPSSSTRSTRTGRARADPRRLAGAGRGRRDVHACDRSRAIAAPTLVRHRRRRQRRRSAERGAARRADPGARVELIEDAGHLLFWEEPERSLRS